MTTSWHWQRWMQYYAAYNTIASDANTGSATAGSVGGKPDLPPEALWASGTLFYNYDRLDTGRTGGLCQATRWPARDPDDGQRTALVAPHPAAAETAATAAGGPATSMVIQRTHRLSRPWRDFASLKEPIWRQTRAGGWPQALAGRLRPRLRVSQICWRQRSPGSCPSWGGEGLPILPTAAVACGP